MTSAVTSSFSRSYSGIESAESFYQQLVFGVGDCKTMSHAKEKRRRRGGNSADSYSVSSRCYLEIAIAKRCRLHKLIRQRFALAIKIQQMLFAMRKFSRDFSQEKPAVASYSIQSQEFQTQRIEEVAKRSSRSDKSAAKQLTTYEELSKMNVNC
ncbi:hypothetical protein F511_14967 [Dorcoceras hygrometricum]|uniref:Uncharacterized protein n=1 Tax=Dorcoceras hygrometricum TaxID=472368 RepID=A0A2Z7DAT0_9LAMI|nr:hypothetical protein F511_14967 [Dorcoceras hygrometricum]